MRLVLTVLAFLALPALSGCTAMMLGGGGNKQYPPGAECPEGQRRTEEGCKA